MHQAKGDFVLKNKKLSMTKFFVLILSLMLAGCASETATPAPSSFPSSASSIPFMLTVDQKQGTLTYTVKCTDTDQKTSAYVTLRHEPGVSKPLASFNPAKCTAVNQEVGSGSAIEMSQLKAGDNLWVGLEAQSPTPGKTYKLWQHYRVGTDGKLYAGDPNVQ